MKISESTIQRVWTYGRVIPGYDPDHWRRDDCGAWMHRDEYLNDQSEFGWRIVAICSGEPHHVNDLKPFQHQNKFDHHSHEAYCLVTAVTHDLPEPNPRSAR